MAPAKRDKWRDKIGIAFLWLIVLVFLLPIIWMILTSLKTPAEVTDPSKLFVFTPSINNYAGVLWRTDFPRYYLNTIIVSAGTIVLSVLIGVPAGYSLARFRSKHSEDFSFFILSARFAAPISILLPFFIVFKIARLYDTTTSLIILDTAMALPFVVWMMRGCFEDIPVELEEAAMVDGCGRVTALWKISLPLVSPGLAATAILSLIFAWNEFLYAVVLTGTEAKTVPVELFAYIGAHTVGGIQWGSAAAAGVLIALPVMLFALVVQKYLIRGLTLGAVKG